MLIKVQKWGNSLAVRIPRAFASQLHIEAGSTVDLSLENRQLVITPNDPPAKVTPSSNELSEENQPMANTEFSLDELFSRISETNLRYETDNAGPHSGGAPAGKELGPIRNLQMEILKLYSTHLNANELQELKTLLAGYFAKKAVHEADNLWEKQNLSNDDLDQWLNEP